MKVFIVYASAGAGHHKAAQAIFNYFKVKDPRIDLSLLDILDYSNFLFKKNYVHSYNFLIRYALPLWAFVFYLTYAKPIRPLVNLIGDMIDRANTKKFASLLIRENPDLIITTHFLSCEIVSRLKIKNKINSKLVTVITDFGVHPFWLAKATDLYIVPSDFTKKRLVKEGISENHIEVCGVPVDQKFLGKFNRTDLCHKLLIEPDKFTVLIVTGSFGIGPIEKIVKLLYREVQVLVVCAGNRRLFNKLKMSRHDNVLVYGFVENLEELMAVSDIIVTKPGGLTLSELLVMDLPPIFIVTIPGQESENAKIMAQYGIGRKISNLQLLKSTILSYKNNPKELERIKEKIRQMRKPFAAREIYNVVCKDSLRNSG